MTELQDAIAGGKSLCLQAPAHVMARWIIPSTTLHRWRHMQPLQDLLHRIKWDFEFGKGEFAL